MSRQRIVLHKRASRRCKLGGVRRSAVRPRGIMKTRCLALAAAVLLAGATVRAPADSSASAPLPAASSSAPVKPGPRLLTPLEMRDNATPPGELRPEHPVTPQVRIPLGKKPPAALNSQPAAPPPGNAASAGDIDPEAARCEALRGEQVRAKCRDELARKARTRRPG